MEKIPFLHHPFPMSYAVVQKSLNQTIDRRTLEEISTVAPSVARGDCARLARELYGVVVQNIGQDEAVVFARLLTSSGFPAEAVPQHELPLLPEPSRKRGLNWDGARLSVIDGMGREQGFPLEEVRFAAGGFVFRQQYQATWSYEWVARPSLHGGFRMQKVSVKDLDNLVKETVFRFELHLGCEPYRLLFPVDADSMLRVRGTMIRFRQKEELVKLLRDWGNLLGRNCCNLGILAAMEEAPMIYPTAGAFEEELVWRLFQAIRGN